MKTSALMSKEIHDRWKSRYRTSENSKFYKMAYGVIAEYFGKIDGPILDAGCGTGEKTIRLVDFGYDVIGVDLADVALKEARAKIEEAGHSNSIKIVQADLTHLAFPDAVFGAIVVWGVLMHIPNLEAVIAELCRVLKPNGKIVVYDANPRSFDAKLLTLLKTLAARDRSVKTKTGIENWFESKDGSILVRWTYYSVLKDLFNKNGMTFDGRRAGQFTELYVHLKSARLRFLVHRWNNVYFKFIRWSLPSYANMIFGKKV